MDSYKKKTHGLGQRPKKYWETEARGKPVWRAVPSSYCIILGTDLEKVPTPLHPVIFLIINF